MNWSRQLGGYVDSGPAIANGVVYLMTSDYLSAHDARTGALVWQIHLPNSDGASPAVANGVLYIGTPRGALRAYDAKSGALLWESPQSGEKFEGAPAVADGVVYIGASDGTVHAFGLP